MNDWRDVKITTIAQALDFAEDAREFPESVRTPEAQVAVILADELLRLRAYVNKEVRL